MQKHFLFSPPAPKYASQVNNFKILEQIPNNWIVFRSRNHLSPVFFESNESNEASISWRQKEILCRVPQAWVNSVTVGFNMVLKMLFSDYEKSSSEIVCGMVIYVEYFIVKMLLIHITSGTLLYFLKYYLFVQHPRLIRSSTFQQEEGNT